MAQIQNDVEQIGAQISKMDTEFEHDINLQNHDSKTKGMIITSLNNIFNICKEQQESRGKKLIKEDIKITEDTKNLVELLNTKLEKINFTIEELVKVYNEYGQDYNIDKAYLERIQERRMMEQALIQRKNDRLEKDRQLNTNTGGKITDYTGLDDTGTRRITRDDLDRWGNTQKLQGNT